MIRKIIVTILFCVSTGVVNLAGLSSPAQAVTTAVVCSNAPTCSAAGLSLLAATLRRPDNDTLGRAHIGIFIMHSYSSYNNFAGCTQLAQRGFTTL